MIHRRTRNYIRRISRDDPELKNRFLHVIGPRDTLEVPVPDKLIVCDVCNRKIETSMVNVLIIDRMPWGIICEECRLKHHPNLRIIEEYKIWRKGKEGGE